MTVTAPSSSTASAARWSRSFTELGLLVALIIMIAIFSQIAPNFLTTQNGLNILRSASYVGIVAFPMTFVIIAGEIDISVGPVAAYAGVLFAILVSRLGVPLPLAFIVILACAAVLGGAVGWLRTIFNVPTFIGTLALWSALRGLALWQSSSLPVSLRSPGFNALFGGTVGGIPTSAIVMLAIFAVFSYLARRTAFGRSVYAVGGNASAARLVGINVHRIRIAVMAGTGLFAALTGILLDARLASGNGNASDGFEFDVIAAVVVGGTSLLGGRGRMIGTLIGVIFTAMLANGLVLCGVDPDVQKVVRGGVILLAVLLNTVVRVKRG